MLQMLPAPSRLNTLLKIKRLPLPRRNSLKTSLESKLKAVAGMAFLTVLALLVHGYHPYAEDAEIYLPGVLKILNPRLFPTNAEFFLEHAGHTLYPNLIALSVRATRLSLPCIALLWQILSIFLLLAASWRLASVLFGIPQASRAPGGSETTDLSYDPSYDPAYFHWGAIALMSALLTLPLAGTTLYILDQFLNPRNLAAFAALFAVAEILDRKYLRAALWLAFAAAVHPFMASFAILFCAWILLLDWGRPQALGFAIALPFGITLVPPPTAYHEVALRQPAHFILRWEWYEWLGLIAPIVIFWWLGTWARRQAAKNLELVSRAMVPFLAVATCAAIVLSSSVRFEALTRLQPMRSLAIGYMVLVVIGGGLLGQYWLRNHVWRWALLFLPLGLGMFFAQLSLFPNSAHVEWPWAHPKNQWAEAFDWIRSNTPPEALFALDPRFMELRGEDENGFRARAERGRLADLIKDKGACSMFPKLSTGWAEQIADLQNFSGFQPEDFERLRQKYGVTWAVVRQSDSSSAQEKALECLFSNSTVRVCRIR